MTVAGVLSLSLGCLVLTALGVSNTASGGAVSKDGLYICAEHADPDNGDQNSQRGRSSFPLGRCSTTPGISSAVNFKTPELAHYERLGWKGISPEENDEGQNSSVKT